MQSNREFNAGIREASAINREMLLSRVGLVPEIKTTFHQSMVAVCMTPSECSKRVCIAPGLLI